MSRKLIILNVLIILNSCSTFKIANKHIHRKLIKNGLVFQQAKLEKYTINYWDSGGDKPVLMLLHGFGATTEFQWYEQVEDFKNNYRLILPDLLYFGGSTANPPGYSIQNQVEAMQELIDKLGINKFYLCGVSYGGLVAAELALVKNQNVKKLIIIDSPIKYFTDADAKAVNEKYKVNGFADLLVPPDFSGLKTLLSICYFNSPKVPRFILKDFYKNLYIEQSAEKKELLHSIDNEKEFFATRNYYFKFPVLLIWGAEDKLIPIHVGKELKEHIGGNATLILIPETAHMPNMEAPKSFNKIVLTFLKEDGQK